MSGHRVVVGVRKSRKSFGHDEKQPRPLIIIAEKKHLSSTAAQSIKVDDDPKTGILIRTLALATIPQ